MKLKDFMKLHAKDFNYEILLRRVDRKGIYIKFTNESEA